MMHLRNFLFLSAFAIAAAAGAQTDFDRRFGAEDYQQDTTLVKSLTLKVEHWHSSRTMSSTAMW